MVNAFLKVMQAGKKRQVSERWAVHKRNRAALVARPDLLACFVVKRK
jgi:hypothetical protein